MKSLKEYDKENQSETEKVEGQDEVYRDTKIGLENW